MVKSKRALIQFFAYIIFLLSWQSIKPVRCEGVEEMGYDYSEGCSKAPEYWGELKEEWKECKYGKLQSPINLIHSNARKAIPAVDDLTISYKPAFASMKIEGHGISIIFEGDAGSIQIDGTDYFLKYGHWHRSSEHFINGISYDLELRMVHKSHNHSVAVVGFLYRIGNPDPFLSQVSEDVSTLRGSTGQAFVGKIDPRSIIRLSSRFYRYIGSLTTPPCTGGVIWTVDKKVHSVSTEQLRLIDQVDDGMNVRPLQRLNSRDITLCCAVGITFC